MKAIHGRASRGCDETEVVPPILLSYPAPGIALVTLNRPSKLNALAANLFETMREYLRQIDGDPEIRAIVLTGAGRGFCAGHDLDELQKRVSLTPAQHVLQIDSEVEILLGFARSATPTIAAVNGPAFGGGLSLAAACDLRIASSMATFSAPLVAAGMSGGVAGLSWTLPRIVGVSHAADLLLTGRVVEAEEALRIGLVSRVVAPADLLDTALAMAASIASHDAHALVMTKRALNGSSGLGLSDAVLLESTIQGIALGSVQRPS